MTLEWNADDVGDIWRSMLNPGETAYKFLDMPLANYSSTSADAVYKNGKVRRHVDVHRLLAGTSAPSCRWP